MSDICPLFERSDASELKFIGVWMQHPVNMQLYVDTAPHGLDGSLFHIAPIVISYFTSEPYKIVPNEQTDIGSGNRFVAGGFLVRADEEAPNEPGGAPFTEYNYTMEDHNGVTICVRQAVTKKNIPTDVEIEQFEKPEKFDTTRLPGAGYFKELARECEEKYGALKKVHNLTLSPDFKIRFEFERGEIWSNEHTSDEYDLNVLRLGVHSKAAIYAQYFLWELGFWISDSQLLEIEPGAVLQLDSNGKVLITNKNWDALDLLIRTLVEKNFTRAREILATDGVDFSLSYDKQELEKAYMEVVKSGDISILRLILEKGAYINGDAYLYASLSHPKVLKILLEKGLQPKTDLFRTAMLEGPMESVKYLVEGGCDPSYGISLAKGNIEILRYLLDSGGDPSFVSDYTIGGGPPLHLAISCGFYECALELLERGADPAALYENRTALELLINPLEYPKDEQGQESPLKEKLLAKLKSLEPKSPEPKMSFLKNLFGRGKQNGLESSDQINDSRNAFETIDEITPLTQKRVHNPNLKILDLRSENERQIEADAQTGKQLPTKLETLITELTDICGKVTCVCTYEEKDIVEGLFEPRNDGGPWVHKRVREIGKELAEISGMEAMKTAYYRVQAIYPPRLHLGEDIPSDVSRAWHFVDEWLH